MGAQAADADEGRLHCKYAHVPIVLTSRADSLQVRLASCAVATLYADARRKRATMAAA